MADAPTAAPAVTGTCETGNTSTEVHDSVNKSDIYLASPGRLEVVKRGSYIPSSLSLDERVRIALEVAEECIQPEELRTLFEKKPIPICYDGFEPSGRMHIAQGILKAINVNRLTRCGCVFVFWVADWFAMLNNKMDGDLAKIRKVGEYFIHVWKAAGMDLTNVRFLWTSEEIVRDPNGYWKMVLDISRHNSITRVKRCGQIMGRQDDDDNKPCAQIIYPCMQAADIFYLGADICQLGMDQRKVNMLAREYVDVYNKQNKAAAKNKKRAAELGGPAQLRKPVILSHGIIPGLLENQAKMSKSDPDSAIFMEDSEDEVRRKIRKAFCPPNIVQDNPICAYLKHMIFPKFEQLRVTKTKGSEDAGAEVVFASYADFESAYIAGEVHPSELKPAVAQAINDLIQPVRDHFANDPEAKKLIEEIRSFKITK